jgi:hypothetical protein
MAHRVPEHLLVIPFIQPYTDVEQWTLRSTPLHAGALEKTTFVMVFSLSATIFRETLLYWTVVESIQMTSQ